MKIQNPNAPKFVPHPDYTGPAVAVDVTPPKKVETRFGVREIFKVVFETTCLRDDGSPFLVWSPGFTASLHEKASFRKFMRGWLGRDLTPAELEEFDTESLIGRTAQLVIAQSDHNGSTYANIVACTPLRTGSIEASGKYVRAKDREAKRDQQFARADQPAANVPAEADDWKSTKVHVGRHTGIELRDLDRESVEALVVRWLPEARAKAKPTADDRRLIAALERAAEEFDNIPY